MTGIRTLRRLTPAQLKAAREEGYSDDEIRADGWEFDEGPGNERTALAPPEERAFQQWAKQNKLTDVDHPDAFYDYRGAFKAGVKPGADAHWPDTFKQHGHPTFSRESQYSAGPGDGGTWQGDKIVPAADFSNVQSGSSTARKPASAIQKLNAALRGGAEGALFGGSSEAAGALAFHRDEDAGLSELRNAEPGQSERQQRAMYESAERGRKEAKEAAPGYYRGGEVAGMFLPVGGAGAAAATGGKFLKSAAKVGAVTAGGTTLLGEGSTGSRLATTPFAAVGGAIAGPALGKLVQGGARLVGPAVRRLAAKLPSRAPVTGPVMSGPSQARALQLIAKKLADDGVPSEAIVEAIGRAQRGDPELLLNIGGENITALARTVQSLPGRGKQTIQTALDEQAVAIPELITQGVEGAIGKKIPSPSARIDELAEAAASAAKPHYDALRQQFVNTADLTRVLKRPAVEDAVKLAQRNILNRGEALPDGATVGLLDDVKKILDAQIETIEEQIAKGTARGADKATVRSLAAAREALIGAVDDATGDAYKAARGVAAEGIGKREAFREGTGALRSRGDELAQQVAQQTPEERALGLEGASTELAERLSSRDPSRAASVFDAKTRRNLDLLTEAMPQAREAIKGTYSRASKLQQQAKASSMRGQSTTASTLAGQDELAGVAGTVMSAFDPGGALTFGVKAATVRLLAKLARAKARTQLGRGSEGVADEIADILTTQLGNPVQSSDVLRLLDQAMRDQGIKQAKAAGRRAASGALGGQAAGRVP